MNNNRKLSVSGGLEMENTAMAISPLHSSTAANNPASQQPEQNASQKQQQQLQNAVKPCEDSYHEVKRTINHLLKRSLSGRTTTTTTSSGSNTKPLVNTDLDIIRIIESSTRIHYSLYKFQSELSPTFSRTIGIKRRLADWLTRDSIKDKRFVKRPPLGTFRDMKPALVVHLYPSYFKLDNDDVYAYEGPMGYFIQTLVGRQVLLPLIAEILAEHTKCQFHDGGILVEVIDHRVPFNTLLSSSNLIRPSTAFGSQGPVQYEVYRFIARPSPGGLLADLQQLREANGLTEEDTLELESKILLSTERNICLHPSPDVGRIASVLEFNKHKLSTRFGASGIGGGRRKRTRLDGTGQTAAVATAAAGSVEDPRDPFERVLALRWPDSYRRSRASESNLKQLYAIASAEGSTKAEFKQVAFVHDWRRNKIVADATQSTCLEKKGSAVAPTLPAGASFASRRLSSVVPNQLIRTMKFAKKSASNPDQTIYTTLNIYAFIDGTFEASLRWGTRPDTSVGGSTLNFAVGDAKAADNYVLHFVNLYVSCEGNALVSDVRIQPEFAAAQRPRAADHPRSRQQQQPSNPATMGGSGGLPSNSPPPPPSAINTTRTASPALTQTPPAVQPVRRSNTIAAPTAQYANNNLPAQGPSQRARSATQSGRADGSASTSSSGRASPATASPNPQAIVNNSSASQAPGTATANDQQRRAVSSNAAFLQRLLRLPFNQVPEQHRALYIQVKQRLAQQQQMKLQQQQQQQQQQFQQSGQITPGAAPGQPPGMVVAQPPPQLQQLMGGAGIRSNQQQPQQIGNSRGPVGNPIAGQQPQTTAQFNGQLTLQQQQELLRQFQQQQQQQQNQQR